MKYNHLIQVLFFITFAFAASDILAQKQNDSLPRFRNTIRINPTPKVIFGGHYYIIGYERILNSKQSISFNLGFLQFPSVRISTLDNFIITNHNKGKWGIGFSFDYRFYLKRRNKFAIPDGLYIGPYLGEYFFHNTIQVLYVEPNVGIVTHIREIDFNIGMIGFQAGYQLVLLKDRLAIDFIMFGPSIAAYSMEIETSNNIGLEESEVLAQIRERMIEKFPGLKDVIDNRNGLKGKASGVNFGPGFRYALQIGFRF